MTDLSGNGVSVTLPAGWEGRVFRRPAAGETPPQPPPPSQPPSPPSTTAGATDRRALDATDPEQLPDATRTAPPDATRSAPPEPPAPEGATTNTVVHVATIPLPNGVGDFASGAVQQLRDNDAIIVVFEYDAASVAQPLFARVGFPREVGPADFSPNVLQRSIRGQAGAQIFFQDGGRAFCLYVVLGSYQNRAQIVPAVNRVLATFAIEGGTSAATTNTVADVIAARAGALDLLDAARRQRHGRPGEERAQRHGPGAGEHRIRRGDPHAAARRS